MSRSIRVFLAFLVIGVAVYFNARNNPFHYDDGHSIKFNPHIRSLENLPAFFTDPHTFSSMRMGYMFRPLLLSSYAFNYALGGQGVQGYHWVNLLLHVGCAFLVYLLICRLSGEQGMGQISGLIFLLHPAHGEVINYLSSRSDLLVSFFYLLGFVLVAGEKAGSRRWSCVAYIGGLLSKSVAITFPAVVALYSVGKNGWKAVVKSWRFYAGLAIISLGYLGIIWINGFVSSSIEKAPRGLDVHAWTQVKVFVYYLLLFGMPARLNVEHQFRVADFPWDPVTLLAGLFLLSLGFWSIRGKNNWIKFGGAWFVITLLPASLVPLNILVSERRAYLASLGLILIMGWAWARFRRRNSRTAAIVGSMICLVYAGMVMERNQVWGSGISLWEDAVRKAPRMSRVRLNLGVAYKNAERKEDSLRELQTVLELEPDYPEAWVLWGNILEDEGEDERAEEAYRQALIQNPHPEGVYYNLGNIYHRDRQKSAEAIPYYQEALKVNPHFVRAYNNLGQAYEMVGRLEEALEYYEKGVADSLYWDESEDVELGGTWFNLGWAAERLGDSSRAVEAYAKAYPLLSKDSKYREFADRALEGIRRLREK